MLELKIMRYFKGVEQHESGSAAWPDAPTITIGICAMGKKTTSKPMREIVSRMELFEFIEIVIFDEKLILHEPIETWPICNCLISFHSKGF